MKSAITKDTGSGVDLNTEPLEKTKSVTKYLLIIILIVFSFQTVLVKSRHGIGPEAVQEMVLLRGAL